MQFRDLPTLAGIVPEFPTPSDRARIAGYSALRLLRSGDHDEVFARVQALLESHEYESQRQKWAALTYIAANLLGLLSSSTAEDLFLDSPDIQFDENEAAQATFDEIRETSHLDLLMLDAVDRASADGDLVLKVYPDGNGSAMIDTVDPSIVFRGEDYFDEYAAQNRDPRRSIAPFVAEPLLVGKRWCVHLEIHEPGLVIHRLYEWRVRSELGREPSFADEGTLGQQLDPSDLRVDDYETGLDSPTLWVCRNDAGTSPFWGRSDYTKPLQQLQDAINHHLSTLVEHGERLMAGGTYVLPSDARAEILMQGQTYGVSGDQQRDYGRRGLGDGTLPTMRRRLLDIRFEDNTNHGITRYVGETPHYEGAFKLLEGLVGLFERISGLTIDGLFERQAVPESGRAMRLQRMRDQRRVARKQIRYASAFSEAALFAVRLAGVQADQPPSWAWSDPWPITDEERAQLLAIRTANKPTLSVESALQRFDGLTAEQAQAEGQALAVESHSTGVTTFRMPPVAPGEFEDERPPEETEQPGGEP